MKKRLLFAALALLLVLGAGLWYYRLRPGLPEDRNWTSMPIDPRIGAQALDILENAGWQRTFTVTEGELRGGAPSGATLTVRWGADWTGFDDGVQMAWEAVWSRQPWFGDYSLALEWVGMNAESVSMPFARRGYRAAAMADGRHYRLADTLGTRGLSWPLPTGADASWGWTELVATFPGRGMNAARLTLTVTRGTRSEADKMTIRQDAVP